MARVVLSLLVLLLCACGEGSGPNLLPPYDGPLTAGQDHPVGYQPGSIDINDLIGAAGGLPFACDTIIFNESFNAAVSPLWGNELGGWTAAGGSYAALSPSTYPSAHSSLPFSLVDFSIEFDIYDVQDGGVWLRSAAAPTSIGRTGVLLVTGGGSSGGTGLYWHVVMGSSYASSLSLVAGLFTPGVSDPHVRVEVSGDTYSVFLDGSSVPATTLTTTAFPSGQVALYDFSNQRFDNVAISVPCTGP